jgi:xylulokinase
MAERLLGLDIGTSGVKVGVVSAEGQLLGLGRASHENDSPQPDWVECPPDRWWQGVRAGIGQACDEAGVAPSEIDAIGVSVLFPCIVPLDADGRALSPALLYCDRRSTAQVAAIEQAIGRDEYEATIGNILTPGTCAVTSMLWLRHERPEAFRSARSLAFSNTAITARLTGEFAADPAMVALSGLVAVDDPRHWNEDLCERLGIAMDRLPRIAAAHEVIGTVTSAASAETGLREGTPVVCGTGDVPASAFACGATEPGTVVYVAGSTDCVAVPVPRPTPDRRWVNCAYIPEESWLPIGTTTSSGVSVEWFVREFLDEAGASGFRRMTELAEGAEPGSGRVLYLPYLQGERTPIWDPAARGSFFGLSTSTTRRDLARAVFEGAAFGLRMVIESVEEVAGAPVRELRAVGGGTKNPLWNQIKADVLGLPLAVLEFQETSALGAALLAGLGVGLYPSFEAAAEVAMSGNRVRQVEPSAERGERYEEFFELFRKFYPATREIAHALADPRRSAAEECGPR